MQKAVQTSDLNSMTAFSSAQGAAGPFAWSWDLRSVNGKGLDIRLRVPDWIPGLEQGLKDLISSAVDRGNVTLNLKIMREDGASRLGVNAHALDDTLTALERIEAAALAKGLSLAPATGADILSVRGVLEATSTEEDTDALCKTLLEDAMPVVKAFLDMRAGEGSKLSEILSGQIDEIERLTGEAVAVLTARRDEMADAFREALARAMEGARQIDEARVAQEIAILSVKADVTEEIDRLRAHIDAARHLLGDGSPVGRKLDFLAQEFNREANTLCSKSQNTELTQVGLALKTVIDQMREQVQNVE